MTAGTPAPQDAETVDKVEVVLRQHRRYWSEVDRDKSDPDGEWVVHRARCLCGEILDDRSLGTFFDQRHLAHVLAALAPVRAREVEAARREAMYALPCTECDQSMRGLGSSTTWRGDQQFTRFRFTCTTETCPTVAFVDYVHQTPLPTHVDDEQHDTKEDDRG